MKNFIPTANTCLCSEHFRTDCFRDYNGKQFLREDAVPTIFAPGQETSRVQSVAAKSRVYDSKGRLLSNGKDMCDCLDVDCMGCFYPCPECGSRKCGVECRCDRKWLYEQVEVEGGEIIRNKFAT
ncbi:hypothetical protein XENOCAPTIV_014910 [Xenoophorus captivus]|uniref:THAP-type domain-containing protein n=1 Tax=Xenoophorus captivus TaxID=1517983 RepID=A0ABV0QIE1_9TELE